MKIPRSMLSFLAFAALLVPTSTQAQESPTFLDEFQILGKGIASKYVQLAEAIPEEQYSWRPDEDARSVAEVLAHVAQVNFGTVAGAGVPLPDAVPKDWSKVTQKEQLSKLIAQSFEAFQSLAAGLEGTDLSQPFPGTQRPSVRMRLYAHTEHHGEHLGQLVAYARSIGVVPPWNA